MNEWKQNLQHLSQMNENRKELKCIYKGFYQDPPKESITKPHFDLANNIFTYIS